MTISNYEDILNAITVGSNFRIVKTAGGLSKNAQSDLFVLYDQEARALAIAQTRIKDRRFTVTMKYYAKYVPEWFEITIERTA